MGIRFQGFVIDVERAEVRAPDGMPVRLRPKAFELLTLFAANSGRVVTKQEIMSAVWPGIHVSDDSLFQCVKELRTALGDGRRELIRAVSGRGYLFSATVESDVSASPKPVADASRTSTRPEVKPRLALVFAAVAVLTVLGGLAISMLTGSPQHHTVTVSPIATTGNDAANVAHASAMSEMLVEGLASIAGLSVAVPTGQSPAGGLAIVSELSNSPDTWILKARLLDRGTGQVHAIATSEVPSSSAPALLHARLVAGVGDQLARSINGLLQNRSRQRPISNFGKVAIEQAAASINQTSRERFGVAEGLLENALGAEPDMPELQVALASLQLRGVQMLWYPAEQRPEIEQRARMLLESALAANPNSIPALEAQCRLLSTLTDFAESLVACSQVLSFDPWNGSALYLVGLGQLYLGRFDDALATFLLADRYDTPAISRWTWRLGAGWANLLLDRPDQALPWIEQSIAITPASGRSHMLLAATYVRLGRLQEAADALARAMELRPASTVGNIFPTSETMSPIMLAASDRIIADLVRLGLPRD
ncbi:DNA-binding winged helix-turn-helix (wHTH) domain-containing protein [Devosia lucknowensis]|uniref:DNA-binding winged helix-turn-helix (WHTH) domain-containing protein n=1 Tax=Devosia lucknowensis TaxID=1096929 RepID=A0A1Y6F5V1_9HYPH|nr:winged helix-turn-helix domain-containing protein [Devosia lucknowensis]SMQ70157.1 DNA-binding winged helix-turn-helix (wHTH) domain-containing protein [Devosia lucknowensis]